MFNDANFSGDTNFFAGLAFRGTCGRLSFGSSLAFLVIIHGLRGCHDQSDEAELVQGDGFGWRGIGLLTPD